MTISVIFANAGSDGRPSAALAFREGTVLGRLRDQLASFGISRQIVITRPELADALRATCATSGVEVIESSGVADDLRAFARVSRTAGRSVVVANADLIAHREALAVLLADPKATTGCLVTRRDYYRALRVLPRVRVDRGFVVSASSAHHVVSRPNATFLSLLRVGPENHEALADAAERLAAMSERAADGRVGEAPDVPALLLVGLVRSGVHVSPRYLRGMHCLRAIDPPAVYAADEELRGIDEDRVLLDAAVKGSDGFFTTHFVSPYSKYIARWAARRHLTPNAVSVFSMALGVVAAACFATGARAGLIAGAVVLQAAFTFDCVDGQLARYTRKFSLLGAWLDSVFDRAKEYVVYAGLAVGAVASGIGDGRWGIWTLAVAALILQALRHLIDFSYGARRRHVVASLPQRPVEDPADGLTEHLAAEPDRTPPEYDAPAPAHATAPASPSPAASPATSGAEPVAVPPPAPARHLSPIRRVKRVIGAVGRESERVPALHWFKRIIVLPIGERFALISVTAAFYDARVTFWALLVWGSVAACYVLVGRLLRSLA